MNKHRQMPLMLNLDRIPINEENNQELLHYMREMIRDYDHEIADIQPRRVSTVEENTMASITLKNWFICGCVLIMDIITAVFLIWVAHRHDHACLQRLWTFILIVLVIHIVLFCVPCCCSTATLKSCLTSWTVFLVNASALIVFGFFLFDDACHSVTHDPFYQFMMVAFIFDCLTLCYDGVRALRFLL